MAWIRTVPFEEATGKLKKLYERVTGPGGNVDNIMMVHSLRPHSMEGHMALYKNVLHHTGNKVPKWFLEVLGVWVSSLERLRLLRRASLCGFAAAVGGRGSAGKRSGRRSRRASRRRRRWSLRRCWRWDMRGC